MLYIIGFIITFIPLLILFPTKVIGRKNLPKGKIIFCCNHQSNNDVLVIGNKAIRRFKFMAKDTLFKNKFKGFILRSLGGYPIKRGQNDIAAIKKTMEFLKNNKSICMFPEGKRVAEGDNADVKTGAIMFSLKTKTPIVPAIIIKKPKIFRRNKMIIGDTLELYNDERFKDKRIDKELLNMGAEILSDEMKKIYDI